MLGLYITGIVIGYIGFGFLLYWVISHWRVWRESKQRQFEVVNSSRGMTKIYRPFVIWIYCFVLFALLLIALFCSFMIATAV